MSRPSWLRLPNRLAVWLALTIVIGLIAIQLVNIGLVILTRPEPAPAIAGRWLSERLVEAANTANPAELAASPAAEELAPWFNLKWGDQPGWIAAREGERGERGPPMLRVMARAIEQRLGRGWRAEIMVSAPSYPFARLLQPFPATPATPPPRAMMRHPDGRDFLVPASLNIALRGPDGRWLAVDSRIGLSTQQKALYFLGYLAAFTLVIGLVAWWAARRLIRPLDRMAAGLAQIGQTRQPQPVPEQGPEELRLIARSVNDMQERIKHFLDERMAMAGAMSHDLRTPLTRLRLRAELAQDEELRAKLLADVDEISGIVEDALALARFDAPLEPASLLDLSLLLHGLADDAADSGQQAVFEGEDGIRIMGHATALRRALANLVDNAAKYGGGARIAARRDAGKAVITVADDGPGIEDADKARVFEAFQRVEGSRNRGTGGSGLGLTIARTIIQAHGGDIALGDARPRGLIVTVRLPLPPS